jgi:hypothetical protein
MFELVGSYIVLLLRL